MAYEKMKRLREEIEGWVRLVGKKRVEEHLRIKVLDLEESVPQSTVYE